MGISIDSLSLSGSNMSVKCVSEWTCLTILVTLIIISHLKIIRPFQRGFFCDDETIRYPYKSAQTIPASLLLIIAFLIPVILVFVLENRKRIWRFWQAIFWTNFGNVTSPFIFGTVITYFFTQTCKLTIGRLRPHFIDVCRPSFNYTSATGAVRTFVMTWDNVDECPHTQYITEYQCTTDQTSQISQAHFSFFSGHSSAVAFSVIFLCMILKNSRIMIKYRILTTSLQALLVTTALFTANSRIFDYWHHWQDVVVGLIVGTITGFLTYTFVHRPKLSSLSRDSERSNEPAAQGRKLSPLI